MKKLTLYTMISLSIVGFSYCGKKGESAEGCKDIGAMDAKMKCENNKVMFCSSYSNYEWKETQACAEGKTCFIAEDGKSGGCK